MAAPKCMQLIKAANQTNRLSTKNFFRVAQAVTASCCIRVKQFSVLSPHFAQKIWDAARVADRSVFRTGREFACARTLAVEVSSECNVAAFCLVALLGFQEKAKSNAAHARCPVPTGQCRSAPQWTELDLDTSDRMQLQ